MTPIRATVVFNPMDLSQRAVGELLWRPGVTLADLLDGLPQAVQWLAYVNGEEAPAERWTETRPAPGSHLVILPAVHGGRTGKTVLRIAATIAVAVAAYQIGGVVAAAHGSFWGATATASIATTGTLAIERAAP